MSLHLLPHERVGFPYNTCATYFEGWLHQTRWAELWTAQDEKGVCIEIQTHNPVKLTRHNILTLLLNTLVCSKEISKVVFHINSEKKNKRKYWMKNIRFKVS